MTRNYQHEAVDTHERRYAYDFDEVLRRYMMRSFSPFMRKGAALEMGCYQGDFTALLSEHYADLTVMEAAENLVENGRSRFGSKVRFLHTRFEDAVPEVRYDTIFLIHTLEHLDEPVNVLGRVREWLNDGGVLIVAVPNANAASRQIAVQMGLISHNDAVTEGEYAHGHRITYNFDTLEKDVRAAGLTVEHRGGVFFKPLANFQFDKLMKTDIIDEAYLEGCYKLGMHYPDLCASIFMVCSKGSI